MYATVWVTCLGTSTTLTTVCPCWNSTTNSHCHGTRIFRASLFHAMLPVAFVVKYRLNLKICENGLALITVPLTSSVRPNCSMIGMYKICVSPSVLYSVVTRKDYHREMTCRSRTAPIDAKNFLQHQSFPNGILCNVTDNSEFLSFSVTEKLMHDSSLS